jgi:cyclopropane-fatty-acyl-phospholipid synthase
MKWVDEQAKRLFLRAADTITHGAIDIVCPDRTYSFSAAGPGPSAIMAIHDERAFGQAILMGDRGLGETYMDGLWSSPDLVGLLRMALRNGPSFNRLNGSWSWLSRQASRWSHWIRANTRAGSRSNVAAHYDLGNEFFGIFLDRDLLYSSAWYERGDESIDQAQINKLERLCAKLQLGPDDHLLEIGTGWGALAEYAVRTRGCRVTTTTISREQHDFARDRFRAMGEAGSRITLLFEDYRDLKGAFDKIVSVEMFEAVGLAHYDDFFAMCGRLVSPTGAVLLQTITINEQDFRQSYGRAEDWMQGYVFPGSELACLSEVLQSVGRVTSLRPFHLEDMGTHYARTLGAWRGRFLERRDTVSRLGFDDRFIRMWDLYLAYSEAAFAERHISDVQLMLTRAYHDGMYFTDCGQAGSRRRSSDYR